MATRRSLFPAEPYPDPDARLTFGGSSEALRKLRDLALAQGLTLEDYVVDGRIRGLTLAISGDDQRRKSDAIMAAWVRTTTKTQS